MEEEVPHLYLLKGFFFIFKMFFFSLIKKCGSQSKGYMKCFLKLIKTHHFLCFILYIKTCLRHSDLTSCRHAGTQRYHIHTVGRGFINTYSYKLILSRDVSVLKLL